MMETVKSDRINNVQVQTGMGIPVGGLRLCPLDRTGAVTKMKNESNKTLFATCYLFFYLCLMSSLKGKKICLSCSIL